MRTNSWSQFLWASGMSSGIYQIKNIKNGSSYIGSAANLNNRWSVHKHSLRRNTHHSKYLQRSWNKYGEESFRFNVLMICERKDLIFYEQRAINVFKPKYNLSRIAGSTLGVSISKETREKISKSLTGRRATAEHRQMLSDLRKGKKKPDGFGAKVTERLKIFWSSEKGIKRKEMMAIANKNRIYTEEIRNKMSASAKARTQNPEFKRIIAESNRRRAKNRI